MGKKFIRITLLIGSISALLYLFFIYLRNSNFLENIEERCLDEFQKDVKQGVGKSDKEWDLIMDIANDNYFKCMKIP